MSQITQEQIRAELRRRGVSEREIGLSHMDDKHKEYEEFLKTNIGLQGDPAYQDVLNEYQNLTQQRAQAFSDFQAQKTDDPSMTAKVDALGRGVMEGVGQVAALPVEAVNASPRLLNFVPGTECANQVASKQTDVCTIKSSVSVYTKLTHTITKLRLSNRRACF